MDKEITLYTTLNTELPGHTMVAVPNELLGEIALIVVERMRQIEIEGFSIGNDDQHIASELALAASCYIAPAGSREESTVDLPFNWPFAPVWWKPTPDNRIRELQKGLALGAAELGRLIRTKQRDKAMFKAWDQMQKTDKFSGTDQNG